MRKMCDFNFRNFEYMYSKEKYLLVATKDEISDDISYLNMIYENVCPLCEDDDRIEYFNVGVCKIDHKNVVRYADCKDNKIICKDLAEKYDSIEEDDKITVLLIKNNLI